MNICYLKCTATWPSPFFSLPLRYIFLRSFTHVFIIFSITSICPSFLPYACVPYFIVPPLVRSVLHYLLETSSCLVIFLFRSFSIPFIFFSLQSLFVHSSLYSFTLSFIFFSIHSHCPSFLSLFHHYVFGDKEPDDICYYL